MEAGIGSPMENWKPLPPRNVREYRERIERIAAQLAGDWLRSNRPQAEVEEKAFKIAKGIVDRVDAAEPPKEEE